MRGDPPLLPQACTMRWRPASRMPTSLPLTSMTSPTASTHTTLGARPWRWVELAQRQRELVAAAAAAAWRQGHLQEPWVQLRWGCFHRLLQLGPALGSCSTHRITSPSPLLLTLPPCPQANIGSLTARRLDKYGAEAWLLSPPCQPYTRRGLQKQSADNRATSFLAVLDLLPQLKVRVWHGVLFMYKQGD